MPNYLIFMTYVRHLSAKSTLSRRVVSCLLVVRPLRNAASVTRDHSLSRCGACGTLYHGILVMHLQDSVGAFGAKWLKKWLQKHRHTGACCVENEVTTGRDRLRLTALTTNHHGGGAKRRSCTFVIYKETRQRQHTWSRTDIVVHAVQLIWGIIWNFTTELLCIKAVKISAGSS